MNPISTSIHQPKRIGSSTKRIVLLAVLVAAIAACGGDSTDTVPATVTDGGGGGGEATVTIDNFEFVSPELTVGIGTTVTWRNVQAAEHTVTGDDEEFDSANLPEGAEFSQIFDTAGTFTYHCEIHPTMTGSVIVEG